MDLYFLYLIKILFKFIFYITFIPLILLLYTTYITRVVFSSIQLISTVRCLHISPFLPLVYGSIVY